MEPKDIGKRLGIGIRVAGRIAQQRAAESSARSSAQPPTPVQGIQENTYAPQATSRPAPNVREAGVQTGRLTRAAGRGVGGFLRPFGRVGGILWLEITGFFFGLFAVYFAQDIWRTRLSYIQGAQHQRFLMAVALTVVFGYLSASAFWRAKRK